MDILSILLIVVILAAAIGILLIYYKDKLLTFVYDREKITKLRDNEFEIVDYNVYVIKPLERSLYILGASLALIAIGFVFYRNFVMALLLTPVSLYYPKIRRRQIINKRKTELKLQFKDALQSLSSSLHAGRSFESALKGSISDLLIQYEPDSYIIIELSMIVRRLEANETVESAFLEFAERSHIEEIESFAEILDICKRTGGNLISAIKSSTDIISDKIEVNSEIQSIISQKKLEQKILTVMPIAIIIMLSTSAMDFMLPVFTEVIGRIVMTFSMGLFIISYLISEKITNIEV